MKVLFSMVVASVLTSAVSAQDDRVRVTGKVLDAKTGVPLSGATVAVKARGLELICNDAGEFQLSVFGGSAADSLEISHLGYKTVKKRLRDIGEGEEFLLNDYSIELRTVTVTSRKLSMKDIDKSLKLIRGGLYAFEKETTNSMYNLFLTFLEDKDPELYKLCNYDLSSVDEDHSALFHDYSTPFKKPVNKKGTIAEDYSEFPVVNISHEAAIIFCQWLTEQYNATTGKRQFAKVRFRLPTLKEWQIAALGYPRFQTWNLHENIVEVVIATDSVQMTPIKGMRKSIQVGTDILYPWYGSYYYRRSAQNHRGCFLGNFKVTKAERPCDIQKPGVDGWTMMAQTANYFPNDMGLYDIVGNVAEMIDERGKACGGSWNDPPERSTIHSVKSYRKPDASIGFRIFMDVLEE